MNNWIPINEFYKSGYTGIVWVTDGAVVDLAGFNGKIFHEIECDQYPHWLTQIFHEIECDRYPHWLTPITKVIPIPTPKP